MRRHVLVTNDFPPKIGGIQNYLWELWRRLDPTVSSVYCTPHRGAVRFDADQQFRIERAPEPVLLPYPWLVERVRRFAHEVDAELVLLDPAVPLGLIGPSLGLPYGVILHGAEVTIPGRFPASRPVLANVLRKASLVVAAGEYALAEAERCADVDLPSVVIPPGVDADRFSPASASHRSTLRHRWGVDDDDFLVAVVTRLVPRKGMQTLVAAIASLGQRHPGLRLVIGGTGREEKRLVGQIADLDAPVTMAGRLADGEVADLYRAADCMAMPCTRRWAGLEQEGFGIVFLEAAASGIPQIAGRSGGADEAVAHGETGLVVDNPESVSAVAGAIESLLVDRDQRVLMGASARDRAIREFDYDRSAQRLQQAIDDVHLPVRPLTR